MRKWSVTQCAQPVGWVMRLAVVRMVTFRGMRTGTGITGVDSGTVAGHLERTKMEKVLIDPSSSCNT